MPGQNPSSRTDPPVCPHHTASQIRSVGERAAPSVSPVVIALGGCGVTEMTLVRVLGYVGLCSSCPDKSQMRSRVRTIAISGLVALATVLGGVAIPATAMAQPTSGVRPMEAVAAAARTAGPARPASGGGGIFGGVPKISCVLATDCVAVEGTSSLSGEGTTAPTRVARWNGKSWKNVGVTLPK